MDDYYDEYDGEPEDYHIDSFDFEMWEKLIKKSIARQGPQYSEYQGCMWE